MEHRSEKLFGYTTKTLFKQVLEIIKKEEITQSAVIHLALEMFCSKYTEGMRVIKNFRKEGAPSRLTDAKLPKKSVRRY